VEINYALCGELRGISLLSVVSPIY
jgi:hypothetical protein